MKRAVVIGSGMGGLTSAILLAKGGWDVTVLEQHYRAGGFLHRFFRDGVGYDTGFHYVGGARADQLFGRAMAHLGVYDAVSWQPLDPDGFDVLSFPDLEVRVPAGLDQYRDRLCDLFPHERAGIDRYFAFHRDAVAAYGWFNLDPDTAPEAILPWEERTLVDVLQECFKDPRLWAILAGQAALYGVPSSEAPFGMHAIVTDHFLQGAYSIEGGGDRLALAMVRRLRELGGRIILKARATAIDLAGGGVSAVFTEDGRTFPADLVIANLHPRRVLDMLPPKSVRPAYADRVREAQVGRKFFGGFFRVEGDLSEVGNRNVYRFSSWDTSVTDAPATPDSIPFYFLTCPGQRTTSTLPGVREVVLALIQTDYTSFGTTRSPAYYEAKQNMLDLLADALRRDHPGWTFTYAEGSTPLTTEHFTGSPEGAAYGHYHSVDQMGRYRLPMITRVRGLVQVGQCVGFPGICGAMMSAYIACAEILENRSMMQELRGG